MSASYDISQPQDYLKRKMFLDPAGSVSMQRFDVVKYPILQQFEKVQRGFFWVPEEIDCSQDARDMKTATPAAKHMFTSNLLRQTTLDSIQGRTPLQVFGPVCSLPEMEALMSVWSFFETNIHSNSYSHIIRNVYTNPSAVFDNVHNVQPIVDMAASIGKYYSALDMMNAQVDVDPSSVDPYEHKRAVWLAMHASYALEAIRFMVSFATSLAMMENRMFMGNGTIIGMILQDELLHTEWTAYIIKTMVKEDEDFARLKEETIDEVYSIYDAVIKEEKEWAEYLNAEGVVVGLNTQILQQFVDWTANEKLAAIGIKYKGESPKSHPIPWFLKHVNLESKQTALQEAESTQYVIGGLSDDIRYDELPLL